MCLLIESVKIFNKTLQNVEYHNQRFNAAHKTLFSTKQDLNIANFIDLNTVPDLGVYKCRILYKENIQNISITAYTPKIIKNLQLVTCNTIEYSYKYENRNLLNQLKAQAFADEIIIVKNDEITDMSYANIVFFTPDGEAYTPLNPLLKGTKRAELIAQNQIKPQLIRVQDLHKFNKIKPINAMLDFNSTPFIPICAIKTKP